ncbi:MAG: DUF4276 family protein [Alphaproteobacteria bacterium]|nr:DUF4276 family protein [Alphaproteobacteria bacterium]
MERLHVFVEGQTEQAFVEEILRGHLWSAGCHSVVARLMGGVPGWTRVRRDIERQLKQDRGCSVALMADYYRLPQTSGRAWPGRAASTGANAVEAALQECVASSMGGGFDQGRFQPLVMMHEFEAMLFSDCEAFGRAIERPDLIPDFQAIRDGFGSPEEIDDSPETAPSKRIKALYGGYDKRLMGNLAALEIGLDRIRAECPHFRSWLERLEVRAASAP